MNKLVLTYYDLIDALLEQTAHPYTPDFRPNFYLPSTKLTQLEAVTRQIADEVEAVAPILLRSDSQTQMYQNGILYTVVTKIPGFDPESAYKLITYEMKHRRFLAPELLLLGLHLPLMMVIDVQGHRITATALPEVTEKEPLNSLLIPRLERLMIRLRLTCLGSLKVLLGCDGRYYVVNCFGVFPEKTSTSRSYLRYTHPNFPPLHQHAIRNFQSSYTTVDRESQRHDNSIINAILRKPISKNSLIYTSPEQFRAWLSTNALSFHMLGQFLFLSSSPSDPSLSGNHSLRVCLESFPDFPAPSPPSSPASSRKSGSSSSSSSSPTPAPSADSFSLPVVPESPRLTLADYGIKVSVLPNSNPPVILQNPRPCFSDSFFQYLVEEMAVRAIRSTLLKKAREEGVEAAAQFLTQTFLSHHNNNNNNNNNTTSSQLNHLSQQINHKFFHPFGLQLEFLNSKTISFARIYQRICQLLHLHDARSNTPLSTDLDQIQTELGTDGQFPPLSIGCSQRAPLPPGKLALEVAQGMVFGDWGESSAHTHLYRGLVALSAGQFEQALESLQVSSVLFGGFEHEPSLLHFAKSRCEHAIGSLIASEASLYRALSSWDLVDSTDLILVHLRAVGRPIIWESVGATRQLIRTLRTQGIFPRYVVSATLEEDTQRLDSPRPVSAVFESTCLSIWTPSSPFSLLKRIPYAQIDQFLFEGDFPVPEHIQIDESSTLIQIRSSHQKEQFTLSSRHERQFWALLLEKDGAHRYLKSYYQTPRILAGLLRQINIIEESITLYLNEHSEVVETDFLAHPHSAIGYESISQARLQSHLMRCASLNTHLLSVESKLVVESQQMLLWLKASYDNLAQRVALHSFFQSLSNIPGPFAGLFPPENKP